VSRQGSGRRPASSRRFLCRLDPRPAARGSARAAHGSVDVGAALAAFAVDRVEHPFHLRAVLELAQRSTFATRRALSVVAACEQIATPGELYRTLEAALAFLVLCDVALGAAQMQGCPLSWQSPFPGRRATYAGPAGVV